MEALVPSPTRQPGCNRLFAARSGTGELWVVHPNADTPVPDLITDSLGWPTALGYGRGMQRLYVADAKDRRIWALDCEGRCKNPTEFLESDALSRPTTLAVALDDTIWLGDLEAQTLMAILPDGTIEGTIRSFSGAKPPPLQ